MNSSSAIYEKSGLQWGESVFGGGMTKQVKLCGISGAALLYMSGVLAAQSFKNLKSVESFVDNGSWELLVAGESAGDVQFDSNHTLPEGKAVKLGSKEHRFWSVKSHPTMKGKFVLRIHSKKSAGWYSFSWNGKQKAWVSKNWPKHQIKKK